MAVVKVSSFSVLYDTIRNTVAELTMSFEVNAIKSTR